MNPILLTEWIIKKCHDLRLEITNLKLQKLLYFAQGHFTQEFEGQRLILEDFEAWVHGPVLMSAYQKYKRYSWFELPKSIPLTSISDEMNDFLDRLLEAYGNKAGTVLEDISHEEDPWINARVGLRPKEPSRRKISFNEIRDFYNSDRKGTLNEQITEDRSFRNDLNENERILADLLGI